MLLHFAFGFENEWNVAYKYAFGIGEYAGEAGKSVTDS